MKFNRECLLILAFLFFALATVGWDFNETAVHSNNCVMPVLDTHANHYGLTDKFQVNNTIYSLGDFMIYIGRTMFIFFFVGYCITLIKDLIEIRKKEKENDNE